MHRQFGEAGAKVLKINEKNSKFQIRNVKEFVTKGHGT